jgi:hypothetical protein
LFLKSYFATGQGTICTDIPYKHQVRRKICYAYFINKQRTIATLWQSNILTQAYTDH